MGNYEKSVQRGGGCVGSFRNQWLFVGWLYFDFAAEDDCIMRFVLADGCILTSRITKSPSQKRKKSYGGGGTRKNELVYLVGPGKIGLCKTLRESGFSAKTRFRSY